mgnify:CR=1 FL=1
MAAGITARQYTNNAVFTEKTATMMLGTTAADAPNDLIEEAVATMGGSLPSGVLLSNTSGFTIWVRVGPGTGPGTGMGGMGVAISSLGSMFFPIAAVPTGGIWVENSAVGATACFAICFE